MQKHILSNHQLKVYASLKLKKYRQKYNKYLVEGEKIVEELFQYNPHICESIIIKNSTDFVKPFAGFGGMVYTADQKSMERLSAHKTPPNIIAVVNLENSKSQSTNKLARQSFYIYLYEMNDPGNLGTILRTAEWFGFDGVILSQNCVDPLNPKVIQSSMGSIFRTPIFHLHSEELMSDYSDFNLIGSTADPALSTAKIPDAQSNDGCILIIGSESHGIPLSLQSRISNWMHIPNYNKAKHPESLNAAISAAILCYSIRKESI